MSERINTDELQSKVNIVSVIGDYISLQKHGAEFYGVCCFHDDKKASLQVNERKQIYQCFACGAGGDVLDFLQRRGASFHEAVAHLKGEKLQLSGEAQKRMAKIKAEPDWKQIKPTSPPLEISHYKNGKPSAVWTYRDAAGKLIGFVCRFNFEGGRKDVIPYVFATNGTKNEWRWLGFGSPRPLYNLDKIAANLS